MKAYKWVCGCKKNPLNNLFPNGEFTIFKPIMFFKGTCKVCGQEAKTVEFEV